MRRGGVEEGRRGGVEELRSLIGVGGIVDIGFIQFICLAFTESGEHSRYFLKLPAKFLIVLFR